jgi:hypothetical protein
LPESAATRLLRRRREGARSGRRAKFFQTFPRKIQAFPKEIQAFPREFQAFSKEIKGFSLAVSNEINGLSAISVDSGLLEFVSSNPHDRDKLGRTDAERDHP